MTIYKKQIPNKSQNTILNFQIYNEVALIDGISFKLFVPVE